MQTLKMALCFALVAALFVGCALFREKPEETTVRLYEQADSALPPENHQTVEIAHTDLRLTINPFPTLTERDVQSAELYDTAGGKAIFLRFDAHGTVLLDEMTTRIRGKYLAVLINKRAVSAWLVDQRIINGQFLIEGDFTDEEARKVVDDLNKLSKKNNGR
jgi:preprotein translocase subunit SecD